MTVRALRSTAQRVQVLAGEAADLHDEISRLVAAVAPWLVELPGMGPISAGQVRSAGPMPVGCVRRRPSPPWLASAPSRRRRGRSPATG
jgi:transposase